MEKQGDVYALVDDKISKDSDFQASLESLDDDEKNIAIKEKKTELVKEEFSSLSKKHSEAEKKADNQKIRAEKAEAEAKKSKKIETSKNDKQSDELDYGKLAYLKSEGIEHPDDRKVVLDEAERLKLSIEKVLKEKHIQSQLKDAKDQREAESGMPEGGGGKSGGNKGSVEYWVNRKDKDGNYLTPTDTKLANKIIDARVKAEEESNMFSDDLHN